MPLKTLGLWLAWAGMALGVYFAWYSETPLWSLIENDASKITRLIVCLFVLGAVASFTLTIYITAAAFRSNKLCVVASRGGLNGVVAELSGGAVDRFFGALYKTIVNRGRPDVEKLLDVQLSTYARASHFIEVIGTLLITLGLIGTVIGLTLTLAGLTGSLEALGYDQQKLLSGLRTAMAGMSTAFYTTLMGSVLGGVLLRVFSQITHNGIDALHDDLMQTCLIYCSSEYKESLEREVRLLKGEFEQMDAYVTSLNVTFSKTREVMAEFREETKRFATNNDVAGEPMDIVINRHREYCELLRKEMRLINALGRPWWVRFLALSPIQKQ